MPCCGSGWRGLARCRQIVHAQKMAALGQLTAGIAQETTRSKTRDVGPRFPRTGLAPKPHPAAGPRFPRTGPGASTAGAPFWQRAVGPPAPRSALQRQRKPKTRQRSVGEPAHFFSSIPRTCRGSPARGAKPLVFPAFILTARSSLRSNICLRRLQTICREHVTLGLRNAHAVRLICDSYRAAGASSSLPGTV